MPGIISWSWFETTEIEKMSEKRDIVDKLEFPLMILIKKGELIFV